MLIKKYCLYLPLFFVRSPLADKTVGGFQGKHDMKKGAT